MKETLVKTLGIEYAIKVPETVEEFDSLAKREGACLQGAVDDCWYRGGAATAREKLYEGILAAKGKQRPTENYGKNADGEVLTRKVPATKANILAELDDDEDLSAYSHILSDWAKSFEFDPSITERSATSRGPGKNAKKAAERLVEKLGSIEAAAEKLSTATGEAVSADLDSIAIALKAQQDRIAAQAQKQLEEAMGL